MIMKAKPGSFGALDIESISPNKYGDIVVYDIELTSLDGCPKIITDGFSINNNIALTTLVGGPSEVGGSFLANYCDLRSLTGAPSTIGGDCEIEYNANLTSLVGGPREIGGYYSVIRCSIDSLEGIPVKIGNGIYLDNNPLTSLQGINKLKEMDGLIGLNYCPIASHILGVFFIKGCRGIDTIGFMNFRKAANIVNRHIEKGRSGLIPCQMELIEAGLADFAQI
jgi:hypothetical protein